MRKREEFEINLDSVNDLLEIIDLKKKKKYKISIELIIEKLLGIEHEEKIHERIIRLR